jgi:colicin import membrane protein
MTDRSSSAFFSSLILHGIVIGVIVALAYTFDSMRPQSPKIFEMVAGAGDNFGATAAPALGSADGIKLATPAMPAPAPEPEPAPPAPAPAVAQAVPVPAPKAIPAKVIPAAKPLPKPVDKSILATMKRTEMRATLKQEAKDKKIADAEKKRRQMTEEQFRKEHGPARANAVGIAGGVVGGSVANHIGGAGGKALTREEANELDTYFSALVSRLKDTFESTKPTDVSDKLTAKVAFMVAADGSISQVHILRSSGNDEFDSAAMEAVRHTHGIGPRPDNKGDEISVDFAMHDDTAP